MASDAIIFKDEISPWLQSVAKGMNDPQPMAEIGERMVTMIKESHTGQRGVADNRPYKQLSARYAKRKAEVGGSHKILFGPSPGAKTSGGGGLFASWRRLRTTATGVSVGAGGARNRKLASAHDGGMADRLGRDSLNRLRIGWPKKTFEKLCKFWLDELITRGRK